MGLTGILEYFRQKRFDQLEKNCCFLFGIIGKSYSEWKVVVKGKIPS